MSKCLDLQATEITGEYNKYKFIKSELRLKCIYMQTVTVLFYELTRVT